MNSRKQILLLNLVKSSVAYKGNIYDVQKFFDTLKSITREKNSSRQKIFPAAIPLRFGCEYHTVSCFSAQRSVTISILPLSTDLLIVAYAGHFKQ